MRRNWYFSFFLSYYYRLTNKIPDVCNKFNLVNYYSVFKVLFAVWPASDALHFCEGHRSPFNFFVDLDKTTRHYRRVIYSHAIIFWRVMSIEQLKSSNSFHLFTKVAKVEMRGLEPLASALQRRRSPSWATSPRLFLVSGLDRIRTCDPCVISTVL